MLVKPQPETINSPSVEEILERMIDRRELLEPIPDNASELAAAVESIMPTNAVNSIFDPIDAATTSPSPIPQPTVDESSDEETRIFILKHDGFVPKSSSQSNTPRIKLKKTPRLRNVPKCNYLLKRGKRKGEVCGIMCRLGDQFCAKHTVKEKKSPAAGFNFETIAVNKKLRNLRISQKYYLLRSQEPTAIFESSGRILKVRLPKSLMPIPKPGSCLKFVKTEEGKKKYKAVWECV